MSQLPIPLHDAAGNVIAYAVIDEQDAALVASERWYLDSDPSRDYGKTYARRNGEYEGRRVAVYLHREIMGLEHGDRRQVDHINGLTLDNRRANLRLADHSLQALNRHRRRERRNVYWDKWHGKWRVLARRDGEMVHVGRFATEAEAKQALQDWRATHGC